MTALCPQRGQRWDDGNDVVDDDCFFVYYAIISFSDTHYFFSTNATKANYTHKNWQNNDKNN